MMKGVNLETKGSLFTDAVVIKAEGGAGSAYGINAEGGSDVVLTNTQISATGAAAAQGIRVLGAGSSLATSNDTIITATSSDGDAIGGLSSDSKVSLIDSTVSVAAAYGGAGWESSNDTQFIMSNSTIEYTSSDGFGNALKLNNVQDAQILNGSKLLSTGVDNGGRAALFANSNSKVQITDSTLRTVNNHSSATVAGLDIGNAAEVNVRGSTIEAIGTSDEVYAVQIFGNNTVLNTSNQTQLVSSHDAVLLSSNNLHVTMADTELVAAGATFTSEIGGAGTQRIDLGAGVVATENNGNLLVVDRDLSTGRSAALCTPPMAGASRRVTQSVW